MNGTIPQAVRNRAKSFLHQNLLEIIDLRKASLSHLQGDLLRSKVETLVCECLQRIESDYDLAGDRPLITEIVDEVIGLGPIESLLRDDEITEIMINGPTNIYIERGGQTEKLPIQFASDASLRTVIHRMVSPLGRRIDESSPMVDARLPDGSRVNAIIPPLALNGPTVTIRKFSREPLSVERLIQLDALTPASAEFLKMAVRRRRNILIAGGTGSGKTTLLNALSSFVPSTERIITIEDAAELKLPQEHVLPLECRPANVEGRGEIGIRDLVRNALRMRPDRIVVGECRGGEALDMLQAMNTGHDGSLTTVHANSPRDALLRLETMVLMAGFELPLRAIREQIASAIQLILFVSRGAQGKRSVTHVCEICGTEEGVILTHDLFLRDPNQGRMTPTGRLPKFSQNLPSTERKAMVALLGRPQGSSSS